MLLSSNTDFQGTLKILSIVLQRTNHTYMVIVDAFSHFVVTVLVKSNNAKTAVKSLLHHWIIKFDPPIYLVTDRGSDYIIRDMAKLCTLKGFWHC